MLQALKVTTAAALLLLAAASPVRAAETVTADDTAKFLAGMQPSANSPLMPLTKDPAWQRHARFFDNAFGQLEQRLALIERISFVSSVIRDYRLASTGSISRRP